MEKRIIILKGCPCTGKSTWANQFITEQLDCNWEVINRDTYRYQIGNGKYTMDHEDKVTQMENDAVDNCIKENKNMIIDATNLNPKYNKKWYDIAEKYGYEIEVKEFYIPYKEAMKRSKERRDKGGLYIPRSVMSKFYRNYYNEKFEEEMTDKRIKDVEIQDRNSLRKCVICDLDGTLALHNKREPFEWEKLPSDVMDTRLKTMLEILDKSGVKIIFITGRPEKQGDIDIKELTTKWLNHNGLYSYILYMRNKEDYRSGEITKKELYEINIKPNYNCIGVFEDSNKCTEMWRSEGLLCLQPDNADY